MHSVTCHVIAGAHRGKVEVGLGLHRKVPLPLAREDFGLGNNITPITHSLYAAMSAFPKVYTVNGPSSTSAASLPSWVTVKSRPKRDAHGHKKRVKTQHSLDQLELIQDFNFPTAAIKIRTTTDGLHAVATGTYKPMIKVWDLEQLTEKFERVTDAENVDFVVSGRRQLSWLRV